MARCAPIRIDWDLVERLEIRIREVEHPVPDVQAVDSNLRRRPRFGLQERIAGDDLRSRSGADIKFPHDARAGICKEDFARRARKQGSAVEEDRVWEIGDFLDRGGRFLERMECVEVDLED